MKRTKKFLALLLALLLVVSVLPLSVAAAGESVAETADSNAISTADEFVQKITANPGEDFHLTNDIDFAGKTFTTPYVINEFYGTLDGNGYSIKNVTLKHTEVSGSDRIGLFGRIGSDTAGTTSGDTTSAITIKDLTIEKMSITVAPTTGGTVLAAGFLSAGNAVRLVKCPVISGVHIVDSKMDVTSSGYTGSSTHYKNFDRPSVCVGGIAGAMVSSVTMNDCSVDSDTEIIVKNTAANDELTVAGIVGCLTGPQAETRTSVFDKCVNNAKISLSYTISDDMTGRNAIAGTVALSQSFYVITHCENNGELSAPSSNNIKCGAIFGIAAQGNNMSLVAECLSTWNNLEIFGQKTGGVQAYKNMVGSNGTATKESTQNNDVERIKDANAFLAMDGANANTIYVLDPEDGSKEIDLGINEFIDKFDGILYGNGVTVKGTFLNSGLFKNVGDNRLSIITDLKLDIKMTVNSGGNCGALIGLTGKQGVVVSNVDVNVDLDATANCNLGGLIGYGRAPRVLNCTVSGSIDTIAGGNVSAFIGVSDNSGSGTHASNATMPTILLNCDNFADITFGENASVESKVGGFIGETRTTWAGVMTNCSNFGNITVGDNIANVAGLVGYMNVGFYAISDCADYGNLGTSVNMSADERLHARVHGFTDTSVTMEYGASLRIADEAGIRFKANVNVDFYDRLVAKYGDDAVSFGTLITPAAFVNAANGIFTKEALDNLIEDREDLFTPTSIPYIDVTADTWFNGEKGSIAGSVLNLEGLYEDELVGRAYVKVTDGQNVDIYYADFYGDDIANNSRSVEYLANAAALDCLYKKDGVSYFIVDGEFVEVTNPDIIAAYTTAIVEIEGYTAYSCYTEAQYGKISQILEAIG